MAIPFLLDFVCEYVCSLIVCVNIFVYMHVSVCMYVYMLKCVCCVYVLLTIGIPLCGIDSFRNEHV